MQQLRKLEAYCIARNIKATFMDGVLRKEPYFIDLAVARYGCQTVVEAMQNKQMTLIL